LLENEHVFEFISGDGQKHQIILKDHQLGFTFCQKPVIYSLSNDEKIKVFFKNGKTNEIKGTSLGKELSRLIFNRSKEVERVEVILGNLNKGNNSKG
jgi:leucyl aminopeptidase (aminopeptidase T)